MKFKNKGRKIYKTKEKNYYDKSPAGKAFSIGLTILLIGGIGFIGYSVAEPIVNYTKRKGDKDIPVTTSAELQTDAPEITTGKSNEIPIQENISAENYKAATVSTADLVSVESLKHAIDNLPSADEIEYVEIPLKVSGGEIFYNSSVYPAVNSGAIQLQADLNEISSIVKSYGLKPVAVMSVFNDNIVPATFPDTGYVTYNTGEQWIDNDYSAGGKPWTTPYSQSALSYVTDIADEISSAGFDKIVCSDFIFPHFRESDLALLDPKLGSKDRYIAMTSAANMLYDCILSNGSTMLIEVSAAELLQGNDDIISQPMLLNVKNIILNINMDEISYGVYTNGTVYEFTGTPAEKTQKMLGLVENKLTDFNIAVRVSGSSLTKAELIEAKDTIEEEGYKSFILG